MVDTDIVSCHAVTPGNNGHAYTVFAKLNSGENVKLCDTDLIEVVDIVFSAYTKRLPDDMKPYSG